MDSIGLAIAALIAVAAVLFLWQFGSRNLPTPSGKAAQTMGVLRERLQARDEQLMELKNQLESQAKRLLNLQEKLHQEIQLRSAAEARNGLIQKLEERLEARETRIQAMQKDTTTLREQLAELQAQRKGEQRSWEEKLGFLNEAQTKLSEAFQALSARALKANNESFLELAKTTLERFQSEAKGDLKHRQKAIEDLLEPMKETLTRFDSQVQEVEKSRREDYGSIRSLVSSLSQSQEKLQSETRNLVRALRVPSVRGRWGEVQLRRVVEIAGMLPYCDFVEQVSARSSEDTLLRPDLLVKLPGGKNVVVDAKAPLQAYLDAWESEDEKKRSALMRQHARQIRNHVAKLSAKSYWEQFTPNPEFVVMFLPGENFFSAALAEDPSLIEEGVNQRVILSTPTTLIALLRAVSYGWRQEKIADNAQMISRLGKDLYQRLSVLSSHVVSLGRGLGRAVDSYNQVVGSMENRVLVAARQFPEMGVTANKQIPHLTPVEKMPRQLHSEDPSDQPEALIRGA